MPRRAKPARSRPYHSHQWRAAAVEFPALAGGIQRACIRADLLARFRSGHPRGSDCRVQSPRTPVWRPGCKDRFLRMAGADPARPLTGAQPASELVLRILSALVLAPVAIGVAYVGGWAFVAFWAVASLVVLWELTKLIVGNDR